MKQSLLSIWKGVFEGSVWRNWCESYDRYHLGKMGGATPEEYIAARSGEWDRFVEKGLELTDFSAIKTPQDAQKSAFEMAKSVLDMLEK